MPRLWQLRPRTTLQRASACVRAFVCVCVRVRVRACACVCVCVRAFLQREITTRPCARALQCCALLPLASGYELTGENVCVHGSRGGRS